jgi:hypothetical protein
MQCTRSHGCLEMEFEGEDISDVVAASREGSFGEARDVHALTIS